MNYTRNYPWATQAPLDSGIMNSINMRNQLSNQLGSTYSGPTTNTASGLKGMFQKLRGGNTGTMPTPLPGQEGMVDTTGTLGKLGKGLKTAGKVAPIAIQGIQGVKNWSDYQNALGDNDSLRGDILRSANSNPLTNSMLTSDQKTMLNQIKRGNYDGTGDKGFFSGVTSNLPDILMNTVMGGAMGGIGGAAIGGLGSLVNSGIQGETSGQEQEAANLEALFQTLQGNEDQYNSMKQYPVKGLGLRPSAIQAMNY